MDFKLLLALTAISFVAYCCNDTCSTEPKFELKKNSSNKTLIVIADDRSGSDIENRNFMESDFKKLSKYISTNGGGAIAAINIGNPKPEHRQALRLVYEIPYDTLNIENCYTLSQRGLIYLWNDSIKSKINSKVINENAIKEKEFYDSLQNQVINYKPNGKDLTYLNRAIISINRLINEKTFNDYKKIVLVLSSDGINDEPGNFNSTPTEKISTKNNMEIYVIGWKDTSYFTDLNYKINILESKVGLIDNIIN